MTPRKSPRYYVTTSTPETRRDEDKAQRPLYGPYVLKSEALGMARLARRNFPSAEVLTHTQAERRYGELVLRTREQLYARVRRVIVGARTWSEIEWTEWETSGEAFESDAWRRGGGR